VAARSKAWVCFCSLAGIVGSNPAVGMEICLLTMPCDVMDRSLRGVLQGVVCLSMIVKPRQ
jgi:hypothetical protein